MIALRKTCAAPGVEACETEAPQGVPGRDQLRIRIQAAGICGSDLHAYDWTSGYEFMKPLLPVTLGHEFCGVVTAIGANVKGFAPGNRVVCWPTVPCGRCEGCGRGQPGQCRNRAIIGLHRDGGFAEWLDIAAASCLSVPDDLPAPIAALAEPLAISVHAVDLSAAGPGDAVLVLGPGPIGLGAAWIAQHRGADVLLAGLNDPERLTCARAMGLDHIVDLAKADLAGAARACFGRDPDIVIEATGHAASVPQGLALLRPCGALIAVGIHSHPCEIDLTRLVREKKRIIGAHDTTRRAFEQAIALLSRHRDALGQMITHHMPLSRGAEAFAIARQGASVKVMLIPDNLTKDADR